MYRQDGDLTNTMLTNAAVCKTSRLIQCYWQLHISDLWGVLVLRCDSHVQISVVLLLSWRKHLLAAWLLHLVLLVLVKSSGNGTILHDTLTLNMVGMSVDVRRLWISVIKGSHWTRFEKLFHISRICGWFYCARKLPVIIHHVNI